MPGATASLTSRTAASTASASATATSSGGGGGSAESPYLYFIALGLGIVFTNLWIILGIRYCCRRHRIADGASDDEADHDQFYSNITAHRGIYLAMTGIDESGRVIRERRRKKPKTLMRIEELDERFPVRKYKQWVTAEGDSFGGGISVEAAQVAAQKRDEATMDATNQDLASKDPSRMTASSVNDARLSSEKDSTVVRVRSELDVDDPVNDAAINREPTSSPANSANLQADPSRHSRDTVSPKPSVDITQQAIDNTETHDDVADNLELPEDANADGDACAICLENLQSEDDIRALTCRHVFHDECIKLWFTSRKASCPLCKHDYYTGPLVSSDPVETGHEHARGEVSTATEEVNSSRNDQGRIRRALGFVSHALVIPGGAVSRS